MSKSETHPILLKNLTTRHKFLWVIESYFSPEPSLLHSLCARDLQEHVIELFMKNTETFVVRHDRSCARSCFLVVIILGIITHLKALTLSSTSRLSTSVSRASSWEKVSEYCRFRRRETGYWTMTENREGWKNMNMS